MNKHRCPICKCDNLILRHEATYIYSYILDGDEPGIENFDTFKSFQYDKREQKESNEYIECGKCGSKYPTNFIFNILEPEIKVKIM